MLNNPMTKPLPNKTPSVNSHQELIITYKDQLIKLTDFNIPTKN